MNAGERLGPYEILAQIGKGGMGEVYKARDTRLGRAVAIKVSSERFTDRFKLEARAVAALNHPHICTLYDVGPNYLVMEYLEGSPLQGPLPEPDAARLITQIADALEAAHARGIIHRDLKPGNIFVTRFGAKLLDFGLAKVDPTPTSGAAVDSERTQMLTEAGAVVGTSSYMSPEQARGGDVDARSDVFSLGVVLYELLSGRRAFTGGSVIEILGAVLHKDAEPLDAPSALSHIVERCLRKSPDERYQSMRELKSALAESLASAPGGQPSIAVLPFANLSSDKENEYFSDGLAEEILNALTQLPGLRVVARASAFAFRGREHAIREIGATLKVSSVLHGSVRRSGNRIRVSAQLIKVDDESQLWSERYDRELRDVFDIQDEISQAIVEKLKVRLGARAGQPLVKRYTENPEAHAAYLKGNFHFYRLTGEGMEKGKAYLDRAVALEPRHAPAWVQLADYYISRCFLGGAAPPLDNWPKAKKMALEAVAADPEYADAQAALAFVTAMSEYNWTQAMDRFDAGLRLNFASARTHFWIGQTLNMMQRPDEAWESYQRAVALDPLFTLYRYVIPLHYLSRADYARAASEALQTLEIDPAYRLAQFTLGYAYSRLGRHEEAIAVLERAVARTPGEHFDLGYLSWSYVLAGRRADAETCVAKLEEKRRSTYVSSSTLALARLGLDDRDGAWKWLEQAAAEHDPNLMYVFQSLEFAPLKAEPRYQELLRRMKLA